MSAKRRKGESSSATQDYDHDKFVNEEAAERFHRVLAGKSLIPERALQPDAETDGEMGVMIAERNWFTLIEKPCTAVDAIVREFYANAKNAKNCVVRVRGRSVSYDRREINDYYNLLNYKNGGYLKRGIESYDLDAIVQQLCKPGTQWATKQNSTEKITFPHTELSRYGKAWYSFICSNLMPTRHQSDVTKERAVLLFAIVTDLQVDVGLIIQSSIARCLQGGTSGGLPHPSLITGLCRRAHVQWGDDELMVPPMAPIDHASIARYRVWDGAVSDPRGAGFILPPVSPVAEQAEPASSSVLEAIHELDRKMERRCRRQNKKIDALARRVDAMLDFNKEFSKTLTQFFSGGGSSSSAVPVHFPVPPDVPAYSPDTVDSSGDASEEEA